MTERAERIKRALIAGGEELRAMWLAEGVAGAEAIPLADIKGLADLNAIIEKQPDGSYGRSLAEAARDSVLAETDEEWWSANLTPTLIGLCKARGLEMHKAGAVAK